MSDYAPIQWFKNGDHPLDRSFRMCDKGHMECEGELVRYFRHPYINGNSPCPQCGRPHDEHGLLDSGGGGQKVCPGDWIVASSQGFVAVNPQQAAENIRLIAKVHGLLEFQQSQSQEDPYDRGVTAGLQTAVSTLAGD